MGDDGIIRIVGNGLLRDERAFGTRILERAGLGDEVVERFHGQLEPFERALTKERNALEQRRRAGELTPVGLRVAEEASHKAVTSHIEAFDRHVSQLQTTRDQRYAQTEAKLSGPDRSEIAALRHDLRMREIREALRADKDAMASLHVTYEQACAEGTRPDLIAAIEEAPAEAPLLKADVIKKGRDLRVRRLEPDIQRLDDMLTAYRYVSSSARRRFGVAPTFTPTAA